MSFAIKTLVPLVIKCFFTSVSLAIETRYQNIPIMAVWRRQCKRLVLVAFLNAIPLALWSSGNHLDAIYYQFSKDLLPISDLPSKIPFFRNRRCLTTKFETE